MRLPYECVTRTQGGQLCLRRMVWISFAIVAADMMGWVMRLQMGMSVVLVSASSDGFAWRREV